MPTASRAWSVSQLRQRSAVADNGFSFLFRSTSSEPCGSPGLAPCSACAVDTAGAGCRGVTGPVPSASLDVSGDRPPAGPTIHTKVPIRDDVEREARAAGAAAASLTDEAVAAALAAAAAMLRERRGEVLAANDADVEAATGRLDEGTIDRLRLDDGRVGRPRAPASGDGGSRPARARDRQPDARQRPGRLGAADPDRRGRRELRGAAERRAGRRRPAAEEPERRRAPNRRRRAPHRHRARRRRACAPRSRKRAFRPRRSAWCGTRIARVRACSSPCPRSSRS